MTTDVSTRRAEQLRHRLVDQLTDRGYLHDPRWQEAFRAVPREAFVTEFMVPSPTGDHRIYNLADPTQHDTALEAVYSDHPLITQQDPGGTSTSSSTAPSLMALMLEALETADGHRVLEIGAGTGYNAALLTHALGDDAVTSVDIHPGLVTAAQAALDRTGYHPTVVCTDGAAGYPQRAPYDRLIATCSVPRVPAAWLAQLRPGGLLLVNVGFGLVRLTVGPDGSANGPFIDYASFMTIRDDIHDVAATARDVLTLADAPSPRRTTVFPETVDERPVVFLRSLIMPGVQQVIVHHPDGPEYVLADPATGSWARAQRRGTSHTASLVEQGPRQLWDELCSLINHWETLHRPELASFRLTVSANGSHVLGSNHSNWELPLHPPGQRTR